MKKALPLAFWCFVFLVFLTPMELGDVWWHLGTGQWILEHMSLPSSDPFSISPEAGAGGSFVLKGFWLCQAAFYVITRFLGLHGLIVFKALVFTLTFFIVQRLSALHGLKAPLSYIILLPAIYIATYYDETRPQTISFLFFALALYLLERTRGAGSAKEEPPGPPPLYSYILLPLVMLAWANMHPGYTIGIAFIAAYMLEGLAVRALGRPRPSSTGFMLACLAALALSSLNPNGLEAVARTRDMLLASFTGSATIHEHMPVKEFSALTSESYLYPSLVAFITLGLASFLLRIRRPDVFHLLIFSAFSVVAIKTFRAGFFFAIAGTPIIARNLSALRKAGWQVRPLYPRVLLAAALGAAALFILWPRTILSGPVVSQGVVPSMAAGFIEREALPGNIYHPYEWGGYLIWRLYPKYRVFIDGRAIGPMREHGEVLAAGPSWKRILEKYGVNTVMYWPLLPYRNEVPPILFALMEDKGWVPVYWDLRSVVFTRAGMAERPLREDTIWELLVSLISANINARPSEARNYTALGEVYLRRGFRADAGKAFMSALALDPGDRKAADGLRMLRR